MNLQTRPWASLALLSLILAPAAAGAQPAPPPPPDATRDGGSSKIWIAAGGAFATVRGDCQECEEEFPYRHSGSVLVNVGVRVNPRMDVGAEVFWVPLNTSDGNIRSTHIDAVAQFRPWTSQGFFVKGGAGMAFIRNWVDAIGPDAINSKALSLVIGAGWAFRPTARVGLQVFGTQHAGALGDIQSAGGNIPDVIGNFWSFGMAVIIR